jgi:hypothetical protein
MNYATSVSNPTAHVTKRKSRLKVYGGVNLYMNEGETFEIELHNPKTISILAKIKLNGNYISSTGIVIRPGQRLFLERFLDTNNKFVFHTYTIDLNTPNWDAIAFNGNVEIEFYDEMSKPSYPHLSGGNWGSGWTTINSGSSWLGGNITYTTNTLGITNSNVNSFYSSTTPEGPNIRSKFDTSRTPLRGSKKSIETGRIEKGESSDQTFTTVNEEFSSYISHKVVYKILPTGTKNAEVKDIVNYCSECGKKQKKEYKFCPSCGNKL